MIPNLLSTLIGLGLVCTVVLDSAAIESHGVVLLVAGALLVVLGVLAWRIDYLKWPGATALVSGAIVTITFASGLAARSAESAYWITFWSGSAAGVVSLWSALYRGPLEQVPT
ncbi:MAG TPA: hypothetical protein VMA09_11695 [Candidatus Binataceae bacterium]|nr:hypothetical protein [Candidatus Binataceae bacterium]